VGPRREGDPAVLIASNARAKAVLGWEPIQSSVDEIVQTAWAWAQADAKRGH
jgi:UDP-glucose 4-epimerase